MATTAQVGNTYANPPFFSLPWTVEHTRTWARAYSYVSQGSRNAGGPKHRSCRRIPKVASVLCYILTASAGCFGFYLGFDTQAQNQRGAERPVAQRRGEGCALVRSVAAVPALACFAGDWPKGTGSSGTLHKSSKYNMNSHNSICAAEGNESAGANSGPHAGATVESSEAGAPRGRTKDC